MTTWFHTPLGTSTRSCVPSARLGCEWLPGPLKLGGLDDARLLDEVRRVHDFEAGAHQRLRRARVDVLDGDPAVVGSDLAQERLHVASQQLGPRAHPGSALEVGDGPRGANRVDERRRLPQRAVQHHRAVAGDEQVRGRDVGVEQGVCAVVDRVAQAHGADEHPEGGAGSPDLLAHARQPVRLHAADVDVRHLPPEGEPAPVVRRERQHRRPPFTGVSPADESRSGRPPCSRRHFSRATSFQRPPSTTDRMVDSAPTWSSAE